MTDKQYPPLPMYVCLVIDGAYGEVTSMLDVRHESPLFTADQMRAYVDADRAQRSALTDAQCDAIATLLDDWAKRKGGDRGLPLWDDESVSHARALIREAITNPSRPGAGNT